MNRKGRSRTTIKGKQFGIFRSRHNVCFVISRRCQEKFKMRWKGSFVVTKKLSEKVYVINKPGEMIGTSVTVDRLKLWKSDSIVELETPVENGSHELSEQVEVEKRFSKQVPNQPGIEAIPEAASTAPAERCQLRRRIRKPARYLD